MLRSMIQLNSKRKGYYARARMTSAVRAGCRFRRCQ